MDEMKQKRFVCFAALLLVLVLPVYAAPAVSIVETEVTDTQAVAYVRGAADVTSITAMLGQYTCEGVEHQTLSDSGLPIKTLILVDNSLSIPKESRAAIKPLLLELIAARKGSEVFSLGTISEDVSILVDFTDDYATLKKAVEGLQHQDQETFLTDALYDYLSAGSFGQSAGAYERILLVSDGVDNKSLGYTKDELLTLLKSRPLPIYTLGVSNGKASNNEELENMFSIARATGAASVLLSEVDGTKLSATLDADRSNQVVTIPIPDAAQDGSLQTLTLSLQTSGGEASASVDQLRMPLSEKTEEPVPAQAPQTVIVQAPEQDRDPMMYGIIGVLALLAVAIVVIAVLLVLRTRKKKELFQKLDPEEERRMREEDEGTQFVSGETELVGDDQTLHVWQDAPTSKITLTDTHAPEHCYQKPITTSILIGFSRDSDICINYDKSVSRKHCEIVKEGGSFYLINHSQSNGTLLNGMRVTEKTPLYDGSTIKMGKVEMRIEIIE